MFKKTGGGDIAEAAARSEGANDRRHESCLIIEKPDATFRPPPHALDERTDDQRLPPSRVRVGNGRGVPSGSSAR